MWLEEMYEYICDNPQFIFKGFLQSGIPQALNSTLDIGSDNISADPNDDNVDNDETEDSEDMDTCYEDDSSINKSAYLAQCYAPEDVNVLLS